MKKPLLISLFLLFIIGAFAQSPNVDSKKFMFPEKIGYVNDFEQLFTADQVQDLNNLIAKHEQKTSNEIAVVSIESYAPFNKLFDYSIGLSNAWKPGKKDKNNGVLIVFGKQIREIRIQVGYGLEKKLEDDEAKRIIDHTIIPEFKAGDYYSGIKKGLLEIIKEIE